MLIVSRVLLVLLAALHAYFAYLEMAAWTQPRTRKAFGTTAEFAEASKTLAANQGLYNLFLVAGLLWAVIAPFPEGRAFGIFFTICVTIAGIYGGVTVSRRILLVQALPGVLALLATVFAA